MNDELQNQVADLIESVQSNTGEAKEFILCLFAIFSFYICYACVKRIPAVIACLNDYKASDSDHGTAIVNIFVCSIGAFCFLISFFVNINIVWLQVWLAPKVYLIEYAATLTK